MKILLIVPPVEHTTKSNQPPLGLLYISSILEENGFETSVIDSGIMGYDFEKLKQVICKKKPVIVGITATTYSRHEAIKTAKLVKNNIPDSIVVVGGPHFSFTADDTLKHIKYIDVVVRGEGEYTMLDLCQSVQGCLGMKNILGISYRHNDKVTHNADRPFIKNLDEIPFPNLKKVPLEKYDQKLPFIEIPCTTVLTTRGCPGKCMFCSTSPMWGRAYRSRSSKNIVDEIEYLLSEYDIGGISFVDDTLNIYKKHIIDLCKEIKKRKLDFRWFADIRVDNIDRDMLREMKAAGCHYVAFGVESGSQKILKKINKKINLDLVRTCAKNCKEVGLITKAFFTFSHPDETYEDIDMTLKFMNELRPYIDVFANAVVAIYPGSYLEEYARNLGILPSNFSWDSPYHSLKNTTVGIPPNIPVYAENFTIDYLAKMIGRVNARGFYKNHEFTVSHTFKKAIETLLHVRDFSELKRYIRFGMYLIQEMIHRQKN